MMESFEDINVFIVSNEWSELHAIVHLLMRFRIVHDWMIDQVRTESSQKEVGAGFSENLTGEISVVLSPRFQTMETTQAYITTSPFMAHLTRS
jgi:hypothetical protein